MTADGRGKGPAAPGGLREYFAGKEMLVTGATGFVARVLIEKVLRDLPEVGRIHVLIRPGADRSGKTESAEERLHREVLGSTVFDRLREACGDEFDVMVRAKLVAVEGDLSAKDLGLAPDVLRRLQSTVRVIVNSAGVVSFDAPLQTAFQTNTMGPLRVLEFAGGCDDAVFAHVSTCYVNGTRQGVVPEEPMDPNSDMTEDGGPYDVDDEAKAIVALIEEVEAESFSPARQREFEKASRRAEAGGQNGPTTVESLRRAWVDGRMEVEGMRWAKRRGWNDTYTFTKAMGEQMVSRRHGGVPTLIYRPSIIESAFEAPEPGWLDGYRMVDPLIVAYGMGQLPDFPGSPDALLDMVPVDMVVNSLLASIPAAHASKGVNVYQLATSSDNPLALRTFCDLVRDHFIETPLRQRGGNGPELPRISLPPLGRFMRRLRLRYMLPLTVLALLAWIASVDAPGPAAAPVAAGQAGLRSEARLLREDLLAVQQRAVQVRVPQDALGTGRAGRRRTGDFRLRRQAHRLASLRGRRPHTGDQALSARDRPEGRGRGDAARAAGARSQAATHIRRTPGGAPAVDRPPRAGKAAEEAASLAAGPRLPPLSGL